jgi:hypothetical protein
MMTDGQRVLVGNNEDSKIPYTRVWFVPAEKDQFGRVYFGYDNWIPQGGMNDQGLFFDYFYNKIKKHSTRVDLVYSKRTLLKDGTPAVEILFDRVLENYMPLKTLILSTYRDEKLIFSAITSIEHPEALIDYLYCTLQLKEYDHPCL